MVALYIIGGIILLIILLLFLPITAQVKFKDDLIVKFKFLGITLYKYKSEKKDKTKEKQSPKTEKITKPKSEEGIFSKLKAKHGFKGAIKEVFSFAGMVLKEVKPELLKIKIRKFKLNLIVVGDDAAATAIEYGAICGIVYPVISFIDQNLDIKLKQINVEAGFNHTKSEFNTSFTVKANLVLLLKIAYKAFNVYKNFSERNGL